MCQPHIVQHPTGMLPPAIRLSISEHLREEPAQETARQAACFESCFADPPLNIHFYCDAFIIHTDFAISHIRFLY